MELVRLPCGVLGQAEQRSVCVLADTGFYVRPCFETARREMWRFAASLSGSEVVYTLYLAIDTQGVFQALPFIV